MAGLNIKYQPKRPGMGAPSVGINDLPRSFSGQVPTNMVNLSKPIGGNQGYQAPGATMNKPPKPAPPVNGFGIGGEPTDPRYVGPPQPNPVGDATPKPGGAGTGYLGPPIPNGTPGPNGAPVPNTTPAPVTSALHVGYNPSAPTNPPLGQGNGIVGNPLTGTPAPGPFEPMPEPTLPGGPVPPTPNPNNVRQNETPQQRIDRLRARPDNNPYRTARIQALRQRVQNEPFPGETPSEPTPSNQKLGNLAELAPPVGYNTFFRDVGKSDALQARKKKIKASAGITDNTKKKAGGGGNEAPAEGEVAPASTGKNKGNGKLTDKQKKRLKRRPQPGTPQRPYQNRGVTYNPLAYGGTLRV